MEKAAFYAFLKAIPKAEIHLHIEAVISKASIKELSRKKNGAELTDAELEDLFSYADLNGFIAAFLKVQDMFSEVADFDLVFADLQQYITDNGISYAEVFFAPSAFIKKGFAYGDIMQNFSTNIAKIKAETGVDVKVLVDVSRTFGLENAEKNLDMLLAHRIPAVIGIGLGGAESKGPCKDFGPVFERARANGLKTVAHAGEDVDAWSIRDAIDVLHAARIGHGITAIQDETLMERLKSERIPLEVAPTSNVFTKKYVPSFEQHPIRAFFDKGLLVTVNTDDPLFFKVSLLDEYWNLHSKLHFTEDEIKQLVLNSFAATFLSDDEKNAWAKKVEASWK
ncbi:MAG: adenosine deaminase [Treponemataceae bacterium]|nr:adenosine deaminase [Treponemataceae bacterium]MDE7391345.1 adenosine deaminase [Treponemataceae bacterium]